MSDKHTPGPWTLPHFAREDHGCDCAYVFGENQNFMGAVATVHYARDEKNESDDPLIDEAKANARLISAAPELLAALQTFVEQAASWHEFHHGDKDIGCDSICAAIPAGRAAIEKATQPVKNV